MEAIARELTVWGVRTARAGAWTGQAIKNLLARGAGQRPLPNKERGI